MDEIRGGAGAFGGLTSSALKDQRVSANGYYRFGDLKVGVGLIRRDNDGSTVTPRSDMWYLEGAYAIAPLFTVDGMFATLKFKNSANKASLLALRGTYLLSKRTAIYATAGHIGNDGALALSVSGANPAAIQRQVRINLGSRWAFGTRSDRA